MVNDEILTSLKNAVERGDNIDNAIQMAINSGYNPKDVEEASRFIGGSSFNFQPKPIEELTMPAEKNMLGGLKKIEPSQMNSRIVGQMSPPPIAPPAMSQIANKNPIVTNVLYKPQVQNIAQQSIPSDISPLKQNYFKPMKPKESYAKEILLLIVLLFLLGVLITTFIFKEKILEFLSKL